MNLRTLPQITVGIGAECTFKDSKELEGMDLFQKTGFNNLLGKVRLFLDGGIATV